MGPNPPYVVHPAKVANLIAELKRLTESGEIDLQGVLIFATERNTGERFDAGEPIATGNVLGQWIATKFDKLTYVGEKEPRFDFKPYEVCWVNMLKGLKDFSGEGPDFPIHRKAAWIIDDAVESIATGLGGAVALVSDTGGIGILKPLIKASAHLRFHNKVVDLPDTETKPVKINIKQSLEESRFASCIESLEARNHCEQRLWQGDFLGAWGAVAHLKDNPDDKDWVGAVKQVADFFLGVELASEALFPELQIVLNSHQNVLRAAFKVEAALQGLIEDDRRITDAILGTVNFYDVALRSKINQILKTFEWVEFSGDEMDGEVCFKGPIPYDCCIEKKLFVIEKKNCLISLGKGGDQDWLQWLEQKKFGALKKYSDHLSQNIIANGKSIRTYRNYVAHRALSHQDANNAIEIAKKKQLWNLPQPNLYDKDQLGQHFLAVPITIEVLKLFNLDNAAQLYRDMVCGLIEWVRGPIHYAEP